MRRQCQGRTKLGAPCVNGKAEWDNKSRLYLCHLHHPDSTFRRQQYEREQARMERRKSRIIAKRLVAESPYRDEL